jgi:molybdopterin-guanine dinucleotide biosynthesis protein A
MDAVLLAGGVPKPDDLLYQYTLGKAKALLEIAGVPMIQWVLDALNQAETIQNIVIVGLAEGSEFRSQKSLHFVPDQKSMLENIRTGIRKAVVVNPRTEFILVVSSDIPAITGEIVDWSVRTSMETDHDLYYTVIPRETMETRFPGSNRSYIRLKDLDVCGADMNMVRAEVAIGRDEIWNKLIAARKNVLKQTALIGYDTLILLLLRRLTLEKAVGIVGKRLGLKGRALISPYAEVGMDVDKPHQFDILRTELEARLDDES